MAIPLSPEDFARKHNDEMELVKRELTRRALDTVRVYNPLEITFAFMYDRYWHRIPAKSFKDMDRYLAIHFFKKICDKMIGDQIMLKGTELKKLREKQMGHQFLDHYEENVEVWDKTPKLDDPDLVEQIKKVVLIGVVEEYGMDEPEPEQQVLDKPMDLRPMHEQIFSTIDRIPTEPDLAPTMVPLKPIEEILQSAQEVHRGPGRPPKNELEKEITV